MTIETAPKPRTIDVDDAIAALNSLHGVNVTELRAYLEGEYTRQTCSRLDDLFTWDKIVGDDQ